MDFASAHQSHQVAHWATAATGRHAHLQNVHIIAFKSALCLVEERKPRAECKTAQNFKGMQNRHHRYDSQNRRSIKYTLSINRNGKIEAKHLSNLS
jgi:hypothetical protein